MQHINAFGLDILKSFETLQLRAYQDSGGVWTIGYGHTGIDVFEGLEIDQERALELLSYDLKWAEEAVHRNISVPLNSNQFSALVVFVFNVGEAAFAKSTMRKLINQGEFLKAAEQFDLWVHVRGVVLRGLQRRREAEKQLFLNLSC